MTDTERSLALGRKSFLAQIYCLLQIGYFKAKQAFFQFSLDEVPLEGVTSEFGKNRTVTIFNIENSTSYKCQTFIVGQSFLYEINRLKNQRHEYRYRTIFSEFCSGPS